MLLFLLEFLLPTSTTVACGPSFDPDVLHNTEDVIRRMPAGVLTKELTRVLPKSRFTFQAKPATDDKRYLPSPEEYAKQRDHAEMSELDRALHAANSQLTKTQLNALQDAYRQQRSLLDNYLHLQAAYVRHTQHSKERTSSEDISSLAPGGSLQDKPKVTTPPERPEFQFPKEMPVEFVLYFHGAAAYQTTQFKAARTYWSDLLKLPKSQRNYRSTWAAYMLGRSYESDEPEKAIEYYRQVRSLVADGFSDSTGLATASLGREARIELQKKNYIQAVDLYLQQLACGDPTAEQSLVRTVHNLIEQKDDALRKKAFADMTLLCVTAAVFVSEHDQFPIHKTFLNVLENAQITQVPCADRMAWMAYRSGDMTAAKRWIARAKADQPIAQWVHAKLLLRDGKLDEAAKILSTILPAFPVTDQVMDERYAVTVYLRPDISGSLAILKLTRRQYIEALDLFLRNGWWDDAAYVAESVLTTEELEQYVVKHWLRPKPEELADEKNLTTYQNAHLALRFRYLLARRLMREDQWLKALPYYPNPSLPHLERYVDAMRIARNKKKSSAERAKALMTAARTLRSYGLALTGTELSPDYAIYGGSFGISAEEETDSSPSELVRDEGKPYTASKDEMWRIAKHVASPNLRFHYRYRAANLAWEAAELMPDETEETAGVLCEAGCWLKVRNPKAADRFYKALVKRCGRTSLGQEAIRIQWFPAPSSNTNITK